MTCRRTSRWYRAPWWHFRRRPLEDVLCTVHGCRWDDHTPDVTPELAIPPRSTVTL